MLSDPLAAGLLLASLGLAALYGIIGRRGPWQVRLPVKAGSVLLLAALSALNETGSLVVAALAFSALGDAALVFRTRGPFLAGLAAFLVAHLLYGWELWSGWDRALPQVWQWGAGLTVLLVVLGMLAAVWNGARGMRVPAVAYGIAILSMALAAILSGNGGILVGAVLFVASDAVLSLETFRIPEDSYLRRYTAPIIWWTYYGAQLLLSLAFARA
ncbi:lysoplasmalogenase [Gellertiella hungarica]|uniref:Putative membrane protein YhhN n=1 Tax=Gellertiella hungarica TaxID=1572859 RepID=A0A7W6J759_9HYPH|nr:lysoplasmalogenase [Gellertiella hungarica]MBB4065133.1 putative membrane protein YhhN [Gellertiella hungarica]